MTSPTPLATFDDLFDLLDDIHQAAVVIGVNESHVRAMQTRRSIPSDYFVRIAESDFGKSNQITLEVLHKLNKAGGPRMNKGRAGRPPRKRAA